VTRSFLSYGERKDEKTKRVFRIPRDHGHKIKEHRADKQLV
jgi:hypothetical protein